MILHFLTCLRVKTAMSSTVITTQHTYLLHGVKDFVQPLSFLKSEVGQSKEREMWSNKSWLSLPVKEIINLSLRKNVCIKKGTTTAQDLSIYYLLMCGNTVKSLSLAKET